MNFCSRASLEAHEQMAGTGVRGEAYVFLPVDKRLWHSSEMNSGWASPEELAAIKQARRAGVVTRLYDPKEEPSPVLIYRAAGGGAIEGLRPLREIFGRRWAIDEAARPRIAICTHGTRDRCCAKFGFAAYRKAVALHASGASIFQPIECSHLGGDRFAATGVVFPSGDMFAHLDEIDLEALARAQAAGILSPDGYRGRVYEPPIKQLVRAGLAQAGLFNDGAAPVQILEQDGARIRARAGGSEFLVTVRDMEVRFFGSCDRMGDGRLSTGTRQTVEAIERIG